MYVCMREREVPFEGGYANNFFRGGGLDPLVLLSCGLTLSWPLPSSGMYSSAFGGRAP